MGILKIKENIMNRKLKAFTNRTFQDFIETCQKVDV